MKVSSLWLAAGLGLVLGLATWAGAAEVKAGEFTLSDLNGKTFISKDMLAGKRVVINFWAAWCSTCKEEIPQLQEFQKKNQADDVLFIGINVGDKATKAKKFQDRYHYPYLVLLDRDKSVTKGYGVTSVPQTLILDNQGEVVFRGSRPPKDMPH